MSSINKVIVVGRVGRDPDMSYTAGGTAVAKISVATSERRKGADGQATEIVEWHRIVLFDRLAEIAGEYVRTGSLVGIEGRLQTREYTVNHGADKRRTTEIIASSLQLLAKAREEDRPREAPPGSHQSEMGSSRAGTEQHRRQQAAARPPAAAPRQNTGSGFDDMDDDIPF